MPIDYDAYPPNWKTEIVPRILARACNKCEECGSYNYAFRLDTKTTVVLTVHHMDEDPENWDVDDDRLIALCQRCHLAKHRGKREANQ